MRAILVLLALALGLVAVTVLSRGDREVEAAGAAGAAAEAAACGSVQFDRYDVGPEGDGLEGRDGTDVRARYGCAYAHQRVGDVLRSVWPGGERRRMRSPAPDCVMAGLGAQSGPKRVVSRARW